MLSHTGEKPFICKQCNYLFVYLHIRHPGTSFLRSSYNYIFKNIAYVIVYVWPSRTWDEILLPFQKGLFFPLGDFRLFLPTRIRICAYAHHPTWIRIIRIRMAIPSVNLMNLFYSTRDLRSFVANWLMLQFMCFCVKFLPPKMRLRDFFDKYRVWCDTGG